MFLTIIGGGISLVHKLGMENFIKGEYAMKQKEVVYSVC
jgi:hypothetical protein